MSKIVLIAFSISFSVGCSNKQLYQGGQDYQKSECVRKAESEAQHLDCLNADKKPYEKYENEREEVLKK